MSVRRSVLMSKERVSNREFETLLRRASECLKSGGPRLVKKAHPLQRKPASAA